MPTGGVTRASMASYLALPCVLRPEYPPLLRPLRRPLLRPLLRPLPGRLKYCTFQPINSHSYPLIYLLRCVLCVGGSWIVPQDALKARDFARITQIAADAVASALASE